MHVKDTTEELPLAVTDIKEEVRFSSAFRNRKRIFMFLLIFKIKSS